MSYETVWTFNTARFTVELGVADETVSPAGYFDFPEDIEFAQEGGWHWFRARVRVLMGVEGSDEQRLLGAAYLSACSYHSLQNFIRPGPNGDFRDMVREAVREARGTLANMVLEGVS